MSPQFRPSGFTLLPNVVKNLLIINGLMFLATIVLMERFGFDLTDQLGLHYFFSEKFKPYQLITYMFMHGSFSHILLNMFAVWMFGSAIENVWGPKRFLAYYIITGLGAAVIHYGIFAYQVAPIMSQIDTVMEAPTESNLQQFFNSKDFQIRSQEMLQKNHKFINTFNELSAKNETEDAIYLSKEYLAEYKTDFLNQQNVVGASGALFGILLAFGMMFPNSLIYIYFAIPIKAKYFVMLYGAIELFSGVSNNPNDNVAHFAHLGGMLFGFIVIKYWQRKGQLY